MSLLLNTGAMHYRENVNDEWKPLVIKANADLTVLADEYSNASTYVVGEYCRYDGQLYRCTTAITTAESWTPAHWTETNIGDELESINDELESINDSYLPLTAGSGKPLTGNLLVVTGTVNSYGPAVILKNTAVDTSATSSSEIKYTTLGYKDAYDRYAAYVEHAFTTVGQSQLTVRVRKMVSGDNLSNGLWFGINNDGTKYVGLDDASGWRSALGLGSSGVLPITIAQGGSGMTGSNLITDISQIATAASGYTITGAWYTNWGKISSLYLNVKKSSAGSGAQMVATMVAGKRSSASGGLGTVLDNTGTAYMSSNGNITFNGTWTANTQKTFMFTYILA